MVTKSLSVPRQVVLNFMEWAKCVKNSPNVAKTHLSGMHCDHGNDEMHEGRAHGADVLTGKLHPENLTQIEIQQHLVWKTHCKELFKHCASMLL